MNNMTAPQTQSPFAVQRKVEKPKNVLELLTNDRFKDEIAKALPKHMTADRMLRVATTTAKSVAKLQQCSIESFASAMLKCSQYGLEPDGRHAHLIPYGDSVQLIFDYKGLVALVRRSGEVSDIMADVVYQDDEFVCERGSTAQLLHRPNLKSLNRTPDHVYAVYSFVKLKDGSFSFEVMTVGEVNAIRDRSQGYQAAKKYNKQSPWDTDWAEMAKKTVFRRHSKWLPLSFELKQALNDDDDNLSDEERFNKAKPAKASVVAPDFGMTTPQALPEPSDEPQVDPAPADTTNEVLGKKPRKEKKGERETLLDEIDNKCQEFGISRRDFEVALASRERLPAAGVQIASCATDLLQEFVRDFADIIADTAN